MVSRFFEVNSRYCDRNSIGTTGSHFLVQMLARDNTSSTLGLDTLDPSCENFPIWPYIDTAAVGGRLQSAFVDSVGFTPSGTVLVEITEYVDEFRKISAEKGVNGSLAGWYIEIINASSGGVPLSPSSYLISNSYIRNNNRIVIESENGDLENAASLGGSVRIIKSPPLAYGEVYEITARQSVIVGQFAGAVPNRPKTTIGNIILTLTDASIRDDEVYSNAVIHFYTKDEFLGHVHQDHALVTDVYLPNDDSIYCCNYVPINVSAGLPRNLPEPGRFAVYAIDEEVAHPFAYGETVLIEKGLKYNLRLLEFTMPNPSVVGNTVLDLEKYPYIHVTLSSQVGVPLDFESRVFTNNPNTRETTFQVLVNTPRDTNDPLIRLDLRSLNITQQLTFDNNDYFIVRITNPLGDELKIVTDTHAPLGVNQLAQFTLFFEISPAE